LFPDSTPFFRAFRHPQWTENPFDARVIHLNSLMMLKHFMEVFTIKVAIYS